MASINVDDLLTSENRSTRTATLRALVRDVNDSLEVFRFMLTAKASSFKQTKLTIKYNGELYFSIVLENKCKKSSRLWLTRAQRSSMRKP